MWRSKARIVAVVESVRHGIVCFSYIVIFAAFIIPFTIEYMENNKKSPASFLVVQLAILFSILLTVKWLLGFELYTIWNILTSCEEDCDFTIALELGRVWEKYKIKVLPIYLIFHFVLLFAGVFVILQICFIIWHITAIRVVQKFNNELEVNLSSHAHTMNNAVENNVV